MPHCFRRLGFRASLGAVFFCLAAVLSLLSPALADDYRLGTMDKLKIRVVQWQTAEGTFRDWDSISGDYTVGPSGSLSLPFIGETPALGKTTAEISKLIGDGLQQKFGLNDRPEASVELAEYRPIFVTGDVQSPGRFPYAPGLTVLKAVSLAGGLRRALDGDGAERNFINAKGNYDVMVADRNRLYAKRARLAAEASNSDSIVAPKELAQVADAVGLVADEEAVKSAREKRMRLQLTQIDDLKSLLGNEIVSLEKKSTTQNRQVELARDELKSIGGLADRGLVVNSRVLSIEQKIADVEGKVLDLDTAALRAKQDINRASQDATNLSNDRAAEIAQSRQQAEADIAALSLKIDMYQRLMAESLAQAPDIGARTSGGRKPQVAYSIVRRVDGTARETSADETTDVLPDDVIKATLIVSQTD